MRDETLTKLAIAGADRLSDDEVVTRVLDGEPALFELIMRRHNQRLFRVARGILRNDAEAEDAVQQAYISAYQRLSQFAGAAKLSTWLTRITIHAALAQLRRARHRAEVALEPPLQEEMMSKLVSPSEDPEQLVARRELTALLELAIDELPEIYRVVIMMRQVQQLSTAETAECLEVTEDVVKVRLHRGTAMLRDAMAARMDALASQTFQFLGARCDRIVATVMAAISSLPLPARRAPNQR